MLISNSKGEAMDLNETLKEKVYRAIEEQKFVGVVQYSEAEYQELLAYTSKYSRSFASGNLPYLGGNGFYKCQLYFENKCGNGYGDNNSEARERCVELFYYWLDENGYIADPIEAVGELD